jgi:hypothetical protein
MQCSREIAPSLEAQSTELSTASVDKETSKPPFDPERDQGLYVKGLYTS